MERSPRCSMTERPPSDNRFTALWLAACVVAAILAYFLWMEHRTHLLAVLPYLILLLCPLLHLLMHRGHGGGKHH